MTREIYEINRDREIVTIKFVEDGRLGTYQQDLEENGIDIKRVMRPIDENTEASLKRKVTFEDGEIPEEIKFLSRSEVIRKLESALK